MCIVDSKKILKELLSQLIECSGSHGSMSTTMQDSLTLLEFLRLNDKLSKMTAEKSITHIASLYEQVACFPGDTVEKRLN